MFGKETQKLFYVVLAPLVVEVYDEGYGGYVEQLDLFGLAVDLQVAD